MFGFLFKKTESDPKLCECGNPSITEPRNAEVLDRLVGFQPQQRCFDCAEEYLKSNATTCSSCGQPIFPGEGYADAGGVGDHPYVCNTMSCSIPGDYIGHWMIESKAS